MFSIKKSNWRTKDFQFPNTTVEFAKGGIDEEGKKVEGFSRRGGKGGKVGRGGKVGKGWMRAAQI